MSKLVLIVAFTVTLQRQDTHGALGINLTVKLDASV